MAVPALFALGKAPKLSEADVYSWCVKYCTFRDGRQPKRAADVPVVMDDDSAKLVRHAFLEKGRIQLIVATARRLSAQVALSDMSPPQDESAQTTILNHTAGSVGVAKIDVSELKQGAIVMIGSRDKNNFDLIGAGGIINAAPPNYRIVGVVASDVQETDQSVSVQVMIRGQHFTSSALLGSDSLVVDVPVMGLDKFTTGNSNEDRGVIESAIQRAYNSMYGDGTGVSPAGVSVPTSTTVTVSERTGSLARLHAEAVGRMVGKATSYAEAMRVPIMYSYATGKSNVLNDDLGRAILQLEESGVAGVKNTIVAARAVRTKLFGVATVRVGDTNTKGFPPDAIAKVKGLEAQLREAQQLLDAEQKKVTELERQLAVAPTAPRQPGIPTPARPTPRLTIPSAVETPALREARERVQEVVRELMDLTKRVRADPSLEAVIASKKLELAAALRVVDAIMA